MSSILTNASAMTALQSLSATNKNLATTQGRISTGLRVAQASDNAAYWSIATTMRSDNKAMSTVQDALGLGAAQVDVAYTAMNATKDVLDNIKTKLVAATQPGVDKAKIQSEIDQLKTSLQSIASSANFSGSNWLSVDSTAGGNYSATQSVVASFTRDSNGVVSVGTIDISLAGISLFDANATGSGLLESAGGNTLTAGFTANSASGAANSTVAMDAFASVTLDADDSISFDLSIDGGDAIRITIDKATADTSIGDATGVIDTDAKMVLALTKALENANLTVGATATDDVSVTVAGGVISFTSNDATTASAISVSNVRASSGGADYNVMDIDITDAVAFNVSLDDAIQGIDNMIASVTTAASDLGAVKSRIDSQQDFVKDLRNAIDRGIGALVDADMNEESTRLQALQVQQQLGIQALSIANGSAQQILSLFR
ncbi:flagellin N-terminal helical domain-containing protein [Pseudaminobacter sp. NGMCC 1.201702]|uniref:flagellin N-terminal helical domain-containing protein n=1 Tax=Pseudaminobacter sp. NGMCC 1.201702 TaxID=3391825 RepID=UPI0039EE37B1